MGSSYLKSIRHARLRCQPFENPDWPLLDENGEPLVDENGALQCTYYVRALTVREATALQEAIKAAPEKDHWWEILARTLCDENGELLPIDRADMEAKSPMSIGRAVTAAAQVNGFGDAAKKS